MPLTRNQIIAVAERKRKQPDDEASLSSSGSFDGESSSAQVLAKASTIRKKSPRKRPNRKRERLVEPKVQEVVAIVEKSSKLTPKKRSLREVDDSSSAFQIEARKAKAKNKTETKRSKVATSSPSDVSNGEIEHVEVRASYVSGLIENPLILPPPPAPSDAPLANSEEEDEDSGDNGENPTEDEEEEEIEERIAFVLPYAISASADELDDDAPPTNQALVTPQHAHNESQEDNDTDNDQEQESSKERTASTDRPSINDYHLPVHVTTEKSEQNNQDDGESSIAASAENDHGEEGMVPRSLLQTLERDNSSTNENAVFSTYGDALQSGSKAATSNKASSSPPRDEDDDEGTLLDNSHQDSLRQVPTNPSKTSMATPQKQRESSSAFSHVYNVETPKRSNVKLLLPKARPTPQTQVSKEVSTNKTYETTRVVSPSGMTETLDNSKVTDFAHPRKKKEKSLLLVLFLVLFKLIAIAEVFAIANFMIPRWFIPNENFDSLPQPTTVGTTMRQRGRNNLFEPWWKKQQQQQVRGESNSIVSAKVVSSTDKWVPESMSKMRQQVATALELLLRDGTKTIEESVLKIQDICSFKIPILLQGGREIIINATHKIREEYSEKALMLLEDSREMFWISANKILAYSYEARMVLENLATMLVEYVNRIREYFSTLLQNDEQKLTDSIKKLEKFVETIRKNQARDVASAISRAVKFQVPIIASMAPNELSKDEEPVVVDAELADEPPVQTIDELKTQELEEVSVGTDNSEDNDLLSNSEDYQYQRDEPIEQSVEQVPVTASEKLVMDETYEDSFQVVEETNDLDIMDSVSDNAQGFDSDRTEEWEASPGLESQESIDQVYQDKIEEQSSSEIVSSDEIQFEANEVRGEAIDESTEVEYDSSSVQEKQSEESESQDTAKEQSPEEGYGRQGAMQSEPENELLEESHDGSILNELLLEESETQAKANDHGAIEDVASQVPRVVATGRTFEQEDPVLEQETNDSGLSKKQVRFSDAVEEIEKGDMDEASLTDTTIGSEDHSFEIELEEEENQDGEEKAPQSTSKAESREKVSLSFPPALLSIAAIVNSTVSKQNTLISQRLSAAKYFLVNKEANSNVKTGLPKRISTWFSKLKTSLAGQTRRLKNLKPFRPKENREHRQRRFDKNISSPLTKLKTKVKNMLPFLKTQRVSTRTPVQLREPVGAPILHKYKASMESNPEYTEKLNNARKDSKHPGNVGRELLRKVGPTIQRSRRAIAQWFKQRFLATKAFLKQETIEASVM